MENNNNEKFEKIIKQYTETKEFQLLETLEDKIIYLKKALFDPNFFTPLLKTDKALSEEQIDYLSKQKAVDNSKSKGESIFFDDNKRLQINISEMIEDISYDSQYTEFKGYHFTIYINDCVFFTPKFTKKEDALDYKKTFINKIHEDYSLIKFLIKDNYDLLCEYLEFLHIEGVNKNIYDYYKEETQKKYKMLELTDNQNEARERRITIDELKKHINKLSEKNKKLKSKNRKLKKQLNKFILKCDGEVVAFDIDKKTGKKSGKGVKLGNINKLTNTGE